MKLIAVLTLALTITDVLLGSIALGPILFLVYPLVFLLSLSIGIAVSVRLMILYKKREKDFVPLLFTILIPIYIIISFVIAYSTSTLALKKMNDEFEASSSAAEREQKYSSIHRGSIKKIDNKLVYECQSCDYRFSFPNTWGFEETDSGSSQATRGYVETFRVTTDNYYDCACDNDEKKGATYNFSSSRDPNLLTQVINYVNYDTRPRQLEINNFSFSFAEIGLIGSSSYGGTDGYFAWFSHEDYHYLIHSYAPSFEEFKKGLSLLLSEFSFIN